MIARAIRSSWRRSGGRARLDFARAAACTLVGLAFSGAMACETRTTTTSDAEEPAAPDRVSAAKARPSASAPDDAQPLAPLARAPQRMPFPARGGTHLGYNLATLEKLRALAGAIEIPEWSAPHAGNARMLRDDDLATVWRCTVQTSSNCAVGIHFPELATVKAVRLFGAGASAPGDYAGHPRPKKVRVHTDAGWADALLPDEPTHGYVVLGKEVETRSLVVEVLGVHGEPGELRLGELEVYGFAGVAREPWDIDPARVAVRTLGNPWLPATEGARTGETYLAVLDERGGAAAFMRGTAMYGKAGDRMLLAEVLDDSTCAQHRGQFFLVDQSTRVIAPIGDLGGVGGEVYRALAGTGFAHGHVGAEQARLMAVLLEGESYERRRTQRRSEQRGADTLKAWKLEDAPSARGGESFAHPPVNCALANDGSIGVLTKATGEPTPDRPGEWLVCRLGDHGSLFVTDHGPCGTAWEIVVIADDTRVVARQGGKRKGSRARVRRWAEDALLVEIGGSDDTTTLWRADRAGIVAFGDGLALAVSPPASCRKRCDTPLVTARE